MFNGGTRKRMVGQPGSPLSPTSSSSSSTSSSYPCMPPLISPPPPPKQVKQESPNEHPEHANTVDPSRGGSDAGGVPPPFYKLPNLPPRDLRDYIWPRYPYPFFWGDRPMPPPLPPTLPAHLTTQPFLGFFFANNNNAPPPAEMETRAKEEREEKFVVRKEEIEVAEEEAAERAARKRKARSNEFMDGPFFRYSKNGDKVINFRLLFFENLNFPPD